MQITGTPNEIIMALAERVKSRRLLLKITQQELADQTRISVWTLRAFEKSGQISLKNLVKVAFALEIEDELQELFSPKKSAGWVDEGVSLDDLMSENPKRKRAK